MSPPKRLTIHIRLDPALLKQLKMVAVENGQSMNAEIAARLERSFGPDDERRREAVKLLTDALSVLDKGL